MDNEDKRFYLSRYRRQKTLVATAKAGLKDIPVSKRKERKAALRELYAAKELLLKYKREWQCSCVQLRLDKTAKQETEKLVAQAARGRKTAIKQLVSAAPPSKDFTFQLIRGPVVSSYKEMFGPKTYLGKWINGAPCLKGRQGFVQEVELESCEHNAAAVKQLMQAYYNQHKDFFGNVIVYFVNQNLNNKCWGISCTTDRKNIKGFAPRPRYGTGGLTDDEER